MGVKKELHRRHIALDDRCSGCGIEVESIAHALFECSNVQQVWNSFDLNDIIADSPHHAPFTEWLLWMNTRVGRDDLRSILTIVWAVWFCRNKHVFAREELDMRAA
uniref:Reverse transcriptase zinc-binding domain-containing protein n=1 Tax=Chenopodium quinoa TaxID=63459 RepID=A0A803N411_CHEQI